jgi:succinate dehydrogenase/fumarate reductase flavoprotein subunit
LTGAAAIGVAAAGSSSPVEAAKIEIPKAWDYDVDVVCVGYGGAGAVTAITAHDAGAKVLILEKMSEGGGNTCVSGGGIFCPTDSKEAYKYLSRLFEYFNSEMDAEVVREFCEESMRNVSFVEGLKEGTKLTQYGGAGHPRVEGSQSARKFAVQRGRKSMVGASSNLWEVLAHAVQEKRKIPILLDTPAKRLVANEAGEVIGVIAVSKGKEISVRARRAVVLTTGGFEFDKRMLQTYFQGFPINALGNPGNTGDGIRMAQQVGAGLWHMNGGSFALGIKVPDFPAGFSIQIGHPGFIYVDKHGQRFVNEKSIEAHAGLLVTNAYDCEALDFPRIPCFAIFDEETRLKGPISMLFHGGYAGKRYKWSADNSVEIDKGWVVKAETLADLAKKIRVAPDVLAATLARWNEDVKKGEDTLFHRPLRPHPKEGEDLLHGNTGPVLSAPIERGPFYALELYPTLINTQGGPRRNVRAQIMDVFDQPIPRLYSAGELGSMWGVIYQGAGNNGESMVFGQIAGRNAAAEKPWA